MIGFLLVFFKKCLNNMKCFFVKIIPKNMLWVFEDLISIFIKLEEPLFWFLCIPFSIVFISINILVGLIGIFLLLIIFISKLIIKKLTYKIYKLNFLKSEFTVKPIVYKKYLKGNYKNIYFIFFKTVLFDVPLKYSFFFFYNWLNIFLKKKKFNFNKEIIFLFIKNYF